MTRHSTPSRALGRCLLAVLLTATILAPPARADSPTADLAERAGVTGGLCLWLGEDDPTFAIDLARTGRFLVHMIVSDETVVASMRARLQDENVHGLVTVQPSDPAGRLPFTEDLVNFIVVDGPAVGYVRGDEISRVLCPGGVVAAKIGTPAERRIREADLAQEPVPGLGAAWVAGRKPVPEEMDDWSHPRQSASGNSVSADERVGPPRRVRWVVAAESEVPTLVSAGGRNFYGAALTRDAYNGLRLWHRNLAGGRDADRFALRRVPRNLAPPVSDGAHLFACVGEEVLALHAATGATARSFKPAGKASALLHDSGRLIAIFADAVRVFDVPTGALLWSHEAAEPRQVVAGDGIVALVEGAARRGEPVEAVVLELDSGEIRWKKSDLPWLAKSSRSVYHGDMLAYEVSTLNNDGPGNALHILSAADGSSIFEHEFFPGMNHARQSRAMFIEDRLWLLHGGRGLEDQKFPIQVSAIDVASGEIETTHSAGLTHCFPPVATSRFFFSGELDLTDLATGDVDGNRITKAGCSRDYGWVPANGLIYATPKHCVCWPMLRGYTALAVARPGGNPAHQDVAEIEFELERGAAPPDPAAAAASFAATDWPCYRHDAWRSGSTEAAGPAALDVLWSAELGGRPGPPSALRADWEENPFVKGSVSPPVVAGGLVFVARPDAHEVVALDSGSGAVRWRFNADGRIDTPPTLHQGLCLFGSKSGQVYCLRAQDGRLVWRLRAAPLEERIVAYGQIESPWPVSGSVLVVDDTAYFAAGRQSFADGGILVFAADPSSGARRWVRRLDTIPQKGYYNSSGLEFDNFDLLHREGSGVAMSRWVFERENGEMSVDVWKAFARLDTGGGAAMVPQGCWTYAPRHQARTKSFKALRSLVVFRDKTLFGTTQDKRSLYRRDFALEDGEKFDPKWMTGWAAGTADREQKEAWRSQRLAKKAAWTVDVHGKGPAVVSAMALARDRLYLAGSDGELSVMSTKDGSRLSGKKLGAPVWDGLAVAEERLFVSTADGRVVCLGAKTP